MSHPLICERFVVPPPVPGVVVKSRAQEIAKKMKQLDDIDVYMDFINKGIQIIEEINTLSKIPPLNNKDIELGWKVGFIAGFEVARALPPLKPKKK